MTVAVYEHLRPALPIELGDAVEGQHVGDHAGHHLGDRRAARHLDDGLVEDHLVDRRGLRRVRLGGLHATPARAGAPADDGLRVLRDVPELLDERFAADDAAHAVLVQRRVALDRQDVVALVLPHDLFEDRLRLVAGGGHQRVVVVQRDHRQHHVLRERVRGTDEAFGAAGAFQAVQPEHGRARLGLHRVRDLRHEGRAEAERGRSERAVLQEAAPRNALTAHHLVERLHVRSFFASTIAAAETGPAGVTGTHKSRASSRLLAGKPRTARASCCFD